MNSDQKALGLLAYQLAEALDDLAIAVENFRIKEQNDPAVEQAFQVVQQAINKARKDSL